MSAEEDTELRDLVIQTLESKGIIGKIKAELRASVFLALEEHDGIGNGLSLKNQKLQDFLNTDKGWTVASLVREFLQFFHLDFTLAVFDPEISSVKELLPRKQLHEQLNLDENKTNKVPLLAELIQVVLSSENISKTKLEPLTEIFQKEEKKEPLHNSVQETINAVPLKSVDEDDDNEDLSMKSDDPFYDDLIPADNKKINLFGLKKDTDSAEVKFDTKPAMRNDTSTSNMKDAKLFNDGFNSKKTFSTLSSLQDLPSLTKKLDSHGVDEDYEDDFQSSLSSHSGKSGHQEPAEIKAESSEHSVEEDIEEDLSALGDDILNSSISFGEDATTDQTISQASAQGGYDYIESIT